MSFLSLARASIVADEVFHYDDRRNDGLNMKNKLKHFATHLRTCDNPRPRQDTEVIRDAWFEKEDTVHLTIDESSQMYKRFVFFYRRDEVSKHRYSSVMGLKGDIYLQERSIMDAFLNTWYFISLRSNRFRFLVASGRNAGDAREQGKKILVLLVR